MSEQQQQMQMPPAQQARNLKIVAMALAGAALVMLLIASLMLSGMFGIPNDNLIGAILGLVGFTDLGIAWFMFNKAQNLR